MSYLPPDIQQKIAEDFGAEHAAEVLAYLLERIPDGLPNGTHPRHLRCILYLASGDRQKLDQSIEMCLSDPRDVMLNAEYEMGPRGGLRRKRDFNKPFQESQLENS